MSGESLPRRCPERVHATCDTPVLAWGGVRGVGQGPGWSATASGPQRTRRACRVSQRARPAEALDHEQEEACLQPCTGGLRCRGVGAA